MPDADGSKPQLSFPLVEGVDYYIEDGRWVFTAEYHRKRGYCCGSGCRHCPYTGEEKRATPGERRP
jgi:hypothetical protein